MAQHGIAPIDLLVVNLYPFAATVRQADCSYEDAVENIDIGGPAMLRAAAKNHERVAVVVDPSQYGSLAAALAEGGTTLAQRRAFAAAAYAHTARYDGQVSGWLSVRADDPPRPKAWPAQLSLAPALAASLRYGENPHQRGALYVEDAQARGIVATARFLQGKELSYNNLADADAALECVRAFEGPACVIVKHANPCGVALGRTCTRPTTAPTRSTRPPPSAASSPSTAASTRAPPARSSSASSWKWCWRPRSPRTRCRCSRRRRTCACWKSASCPRRRRPGYEFKRIAGGLLVQDADSDALTPPTCAWSASWRRRRRSWKTCCSPGRWPCT
jgi:phosphoribosylaminoimidazolecarboxamide formyltransferase/IMP cyclohydrolase